MVSACSGWGACVFIGDADRFIVGLVLSSFICMLARACMLVWSGVVGFLGLVGGRSVVGWGGV